MPPNSISKAPVVRSICESDQKEFHDRKLIRTDYILQNIYSYLIKGVYKFDAMRAANSDEELLFIELKRIVDDFLHCNGTKVQVLCAQLIITPESLASSINDICNELFVEGYTWSRVISFFVFVSTLTIQCVENNMSENIVDLMYENYCRLVKEKLKPWIDDHGGWNGILCLKKDRPVGWTKNLLRSTASVIGTLAHLSSFP